MTARYVMVAAILLASRLGAGEDKKDDKDKLQGEWVVVSQEMKGKKSEGEAVTTWKRLIIKGDDWMAQQSGAKFTFKIDSTKNPKELDLRIKDKEATWRGIYKIDGDTLTFCRSHIPTGERPQEFKASDDVVLFVFKRSGT